MKHSKEFDIIIKDSRLTAIELGWNHINSYHFLIAILKSDNLPSKIFKHKQWDFKSLANSLNNKISEAHSGDYYVTKELEDSIVLSKYYAWLFGAFEIQPEHVIFAMLANKNSLAGNYLTSIGMDYTNFKAKTNSKLKTNKLFESIARNNLAIKIGLPKLIYDMARM